MSLKLSAQAAEGKEASLTGCPVVSLLPKCSVEVVVVHGDGAETLNPRWVFWWVWGGGREICLSTTEPSYFAPK